MKNKVFNLIAICALCMFASFAAFAQTRTDLQLRRALYFTGNEPGDIDLKNDKYVAENGVMNLKKSEAFKTEGAYFYFYFGFIAFREPAGLQFQTYVQYQSKLQTIGNTTTFLNNEKTRQGVFPLKLQMGRNVIKAVIDPFQKTAETDENNNSFTVTIVVVE
jgi:hypothetical protein